MISRCFASEQGIYRFNKNKVNINYDNNDVFKDLSMNFICNFMYKKPKRQIQLFKLCSNILKIVCLYFYIYVNQSTTTSPSSFGSGQCTIIWNIHLWWKHYYFQKCLHQSEDYSRVNMKIKKPMINLVLHVWYGKKIEKIIIFLWNSLVWLASELHVISQNH